MFGWVHTGSNEHKAAHFDNWTDVRGRYFSVRRGEEKTFAELLAKWDQGVQAPLIAFRDMGGCQLGEGFKVARGGYWY